MHYAKIEASADAFDLFEVHHDNATMIGTKPRPRKAVDREVIAYARWLAAKGGLYPFECADVSAGQSVTFGECLCASTWDREAQGWTMAQYESGAYSIPMPGRNANRDKVTMETLDDDGEVIATSTLPVEPKKGGVVWDRDAVRKAAGKVARPYHGKRKATLSAETGADAEISPVQTREAVEGTAELVTPVSCASGPEIAPETPCATECEKPADLSTEPSLADQVVVLAAMVEDMRAQLASLAPASPVVEMTAPIVEMHKRTPAHERAIRLAWKRRRESRLRRDIAADHMRMREQVQEELRRVHLQAGGDRIWLRKRRKWALMLARDLQTKAREARKMAGRHRDARNASDDRVKELAYDLRKQSRRADEAERGNLRLSDVLRERDEEIATLKSIPHHMGQPVAMDDYQRLTRERDAALASLASEREKRSQLRHALDRGTDMLEMMTDRALRAENALRAVEVRRDRSATPYRANVRAVTFGAAA